MLRAAALAPLLALVLAAPASAEVYCVPGPCTTGDPGTYTVRTAVAAADAHAGPDTVQIAAGTYDTQESDTNGVYVSATDTEIVGAGIGQTFLTVPDTTQNSGRTIVFGYMSRLADVTLRIPNVNVAFNAIVGAADVYGGVAERVRVELAPGATIGPGLNDGSAEGIYLRGGTLRDSQVIFDPDDDVLAVRVIGDSFNAPPLAGALENVQITARTGIYSDPDTIQAGVDPAEPPQTATASKVRVRAHSPLTVLDGHMRVSDSLLDARPATQASEIGAAVSSGRSDPTSLTLDRVTVVGNGSASSTGLSVGAGSQSTAAPVEFAGRHLVVAGFGKTLRRGHGGGGANIRIDYSNANLAPAAITDAGSGAGAITSTFAPGNRSGAPRFVNRAAGDFKLTVGSPGVDIGGPSLLPAGATDLAGAARPHDGDGDGAAQFDAGAFEYLGPPDLVIPVVTGLVVDPAEWALADGLTATATSPPRGTRFRYTLSERARVQLKIQQRKPGRKKNGQCVKPSKAPEGAKSCTRWVLKHTLTRNQGAGKRSVRYTGRVAGSKLKPGRHRVVVVATDLVGNRGKPKRKRFRVVPR